jgi:hypothetical protein
MAQNSKAKEKIIFVCNHPSIASRLKGGALSNRIKVFGAFTNEQAYSSLDNWNVITIILDADAKEGSEKETSKAILDYKELIATLNSSEYKGLVVAVSDNKEKLMTFQLKYNVRGYDWNTIKTKINDGSLVS